MSARDDLGAALARVRGLHGRIAADAFPRGGTLTCTTCGATRDMSTGDGARYLASGWPKCCGLTMRLTTAEPTDGGAP